VTENQKRLELFSLTLTGKAKEWLQFIPCLKSAIRNELEHKFSDRFIPISKFMKKRAEIAYLKQQLKESLLDAWE